METEVIAALIVWLKSNQEKVSTAAIIHHFQDTICAPLLAKEQAEIMQWGDDFKATDEFQDVLLSLRKAHQKQQLQALHAKMHGAGMGSLNEQDRVLYLQLLQRS